MNTLRQCWKRSLPAVAFMAMLGTSQNSPGADAEPAPAGQPSPSTADQPAASSANAAPAPSIMDPRMAKRYGLKPAPNANNGAVQPDYGDLNAVEAKLDQIQFKEVPAFDGLPLTEVLKFVEEKTRELDPAKQGLNFIISNASNDPGTAVPTTIDPNTGLPIAEPADLAGITIRFNSSLRNLRLRGLLDAITKVADRPIQYKVVEYGVLFCPGHGVDAKSKTASAQTADPAIATRYGMNPAMADRYGGMNPAMAARYGLPSMRSAQGIEAIQNKLAQITFTQLPEWDNIPLPTVLTYLAEQALRQDSEKRGINFLIGTAPNAPVGMVSRAASMEKPEAADARLKRLHELRAEQEAKVKELKDTCDELRRDLLISVSDSEDSSPSLEPDAVRRIDSERIAAMATYTRLSAMIERLGSMPRLDMINALPSAYPDQVLSDLMQKRNTVEQEVARLSTLYGPDHPEYKRAASAQKTICEQLDERASGILEGLRVQASAAKAQAEQLEKELAQTKQRDIENTAKYSPYFAKKRQWDAQQRMLDAVNVRISQEILEATIRGPEPRSHAGQATEMPVVPADMNNVTVTCKLPLRNMRLVDVLGAITKLASAPISYSVEEYGVIFTPRTQREVAAK